MDAGSHPRPLVASLVLVLAAGVYLNALHNPFVYDDHHLVVANPSLQHLANVRAIVLHDVTRPVVNLSYAVDRALWGDQPWGFHVTSVLWHALNALLLLLLVRRLIEDRAAAGEAPGLGLSPFAAAAMFAVHPMLTEAVGYVGGRSEVMCTAFVLLAMLSGRRWLRGDGPQWAVLTLAFWIAGLAAKESAAMVPFLLAAYDWLINREGGTPASRRWLTVHVPFIGVAALAGLTRLWVLSTIEYPGTASVHGNLVPVALDVIRRYIGLLVVPSGQTIFHAVPPTAVFSAETLLASLILSSLAILAWLLRRPEPAVSFGITWFLLLLVPSSALVLLNRGEPMAEHRIYLASCGLFLSAGVAFGWLAGRLADSGPVARWAASLGLTVLLITYGLETLARNAVWSDPVRLWQESVSLAPGHFRPRLLLGEALHDAGRYDDAIEQFRIAIRLRPNDPIGYAKIGLSLAQAGRFKPASTAFEQLRALDPSSPAAPNGLGSVALLSGHPDAARTYFLEALAADPGNLPARQSLVALNERERGDPAEAIRLCQEIQRIAPDTDGVADCIRRNQQRLTAERTHEVRGPTP
jgi:tetratricopeptide (TPR) repeat protein